MLKGHHNNMTGIVHIYSFQQSFFCPANRDKRIAPKPGVEFQKHICFVPPSTSNDESRIESVLFCQPNLSVCASMELLLFSIVFLYFYNRAYRRESREGNSFTVNFQSCVHCHFPSQNVNQRELYPPQLIRR